MKMKDFYLVLFILLLSIVCGNAFITKSIAHYSHQYVSLRFQKRFFTKVILRPRQSTFKIFNSISSFDIVNTASDSISSGLNIDHISSLLLNKSFLDDDLPNILGINPIEAAVIAAICYALYGPDALYEFAREIGSFIGKYAPVIQGIATDIYKEFREYFDEDQERDLLKKQGFNMDNIPRRTSNALERIVQSFEAMTSSDKNKSVGNMFSRSSSSVDDGVDDDIDIGYEEGLDGAVMLSGQGVSTPKNKITTDLATDKIIPNELVSEDGVIKTRRKSKREVLVERNIDVNEVIEKAKKPMVDEDVAALGESMRIIKERMENFQKQQQSPPLPLPSFGLDNDDSNDYNDMNMKDLDFDNDFDMEDNSNAYSYSKPVPEPMSKFQQQLSGQWNMKVMQQQQQQVQSSEAFMHSNFKADIPSELSSLDAVEDIDKGKDIDVQAVLLELDEDYAKLRTRLVGLIEYASLRTVTVTATATEPDHIAQGSVQRDTMQTQGLEDINISSSSSNNSTKYWPPRIKPKYN